MSSVVNELPTIRCCTDISSAKSLPINSIIANEDKHCIDQLIDRFKPSTWIHGNVRSGAPIVIWFGAQHSSLRAALIAHLTVEDITLILFSVEDHLWQWLDLNSSLTVASLVLQPTVHIQQLIARSHTYIGIRSILVRCVTADLTAIQRFSRSYAKVDGIFDDDTRLLIKLVADLTLFSEELGDQQRDDESNEMAVQRNYDRALKLCALVQKFLERVQSVSAYLNNRQ